MKVNWKILKKPSFIIGAIVLFFMLLFLLNRSSASTAATTTVSGTDPNVLAANTQLGLAQISATVQGQAIQADYAKTQDSDQTQLALATIAAGVQTAEDAANASIAAQTVAAQVHGLDLQYQTAVANNQAQLDALKSQNDVVLATAAINANLQEALSANQLTAYGYNAAVGAINSAKKGNRDELTAQLIAGITGGGVNYQGGKGGSVIVPNAGQPTPTTTNGSHGQSGVNLLNIISPISGLL